MENPKVSVVMSVYNEEKFLKEAIESILNQTYRDFEFIIINDGSSDGSQKIIEDYQKDRRIILINQKKSGLAKSLNKGIKLAKGKYIARMDGDDTSEPQRLEKQVEILNNNPDVAIVTSWVRVIEENGEPIGILKIPEGEKLHRTLKRRNVICHGSVMIRKDVLSIAGFYPEVWKFSQDYALWHKLVTLGYKFYVIPEALYNYRLSRKSVAKMVEQGIYRTMTKKGYELNNMNSRVINKFVSEEKKEALYQYMVGTFKLKTGDSRNAIKYYVNSLKIYPIQPRCWYRFAISLLPNSIGIKLDEIGVMTIDEAYSILMRLKRLIRR